MPDVGTRLYIAPEVMSSKGGPRDHTKADIYSLGVGFAYAYRLLILIAVS